MILFFNLRQQLDQGVQDIYQHSSLHDWLIRQKIRKFPKPNPNYFSSYPNSTYQETYLNISL